MSADHPQVTIVTICRNAADEIAATMASVLEQSYDDFEYVVVDGCSNDGTLERIKSLATARTRWISERDTGIYDAMNKGARMAKGDWILFMNAGDRFYSPHSLSELLREPITELDAIYGDHEVRYPSNFARIRKASETAALWKGMVCSHQALICRTRWLLEQPFAAGSLAEDFRFLMHLYASGRKIERRSVIVASISACGVSDMRRTDVVSDYLRIVTRYDRRLRVRAYYGVAIVVNSLKGLLRKLIPPRFWQWLVARKYGFAHQNRT